MQITGKTSFAFQAMILLTHIELDQIADAAIKDLVDRVNESNDEVFANTVRGNEVFSPEMAEKVKPMLSDGLPAGLTDRILKRLAEHEQELKASDPEAYARYLKRVAALADLLDAEEKKPTRPGWGN